MSEAGWTIVRRGPRGTEVAVFIPVELLPLGDTEPQWWEDEQNLTLVWRDGRRQVWPWASVLKADYAPPSRSAGETA